MLCKFTIAAIVGAAVANGFGFGGFDQNTSRSGADSRRSASTRGTRGSSGRTTRRSASSKRSSPQRETLDRTSYRQVETTPSGSLDGFGGFGGFGGGFGGFGGGFGNSPFGGSGMSAGTPPAMGDMVTPPASTNWSTPASSTPA